MRKAILLIFFMSSFGISAQDISKSDFQNSDWFVGVNGESLFKTDTLRISKLTTIEPKEYSHMWMFLEMDYLQVESFSTLEFSNSDTFIEEVDKDACRFNFSDRIKWEFNNETQTLILSKNKNLIAEYKVISKMTDFTKWNNKSNENPIELSASILTLELRKLRK